MSSYSYIENNAQFTAYLERLRERNTGSLALDIEGEFNLHVYGERFCLLQLYDGEEEAVVDPFGVSADQLKRLLEDRDLLKITYDSASDRVLLAKSHGIIMNSILDLKPAVEVLDVPKQDLKSVMRELLNVDSDGSKKQFQQYNWTKRPIDPAAIEYAIQDVRHLYELKDALLEELAREGRLETYILENLKRQDREPDTNRKPGVFRSGRYRRLRGEQKQRFQRMYEIRDRYARELDLPPDTVLANGDLFALAMGEKGPGDVRRNRRVPAAKLDALKQELEG